MNLLRVGKVEALKIYRYRNRYRGKSLFTYRLLTELRIPLPYISAFWLILLPRWPQMAISDTQANLRCLKMVLMD